MGGARGCCKGIGGGGDAECMKHWWSSSLLSYSLLVWESTSLRTKPPKFTPWFLNLSKTTSSQSHSFSVLAQPVHY